MTMARITKASYWLRKHRKAVNHAIKDRGACLEFWIANKLNDMNDGNIDEYERDAYNQYGIDAVIYSFVDQHDTECMGCDLDYRMGEDSPYSVFVKSRHDTKDELESEAQEAEEHIEQRSWSELNKRLNADPAKWLDDENTWGVEAIEAFLNGWRARCHRRSPMPSKAERAEMRSTPDFMNNMFEKHFAPPQNKENQKPTEHTEDIELAHSGENDISPADVEDVLFSVSLKPQGISIFRDNMPHIDDEPDAHAAKSRIFTLTIKNVPTSVLIDQKARQNLIDNAIETITELNEQNDDNTGGVDYEHMYT